MSVAERSKAAVERRLEELEAGHSGFAIHQTTWEASSGQYSNAVERFESGRVAGVTVRVVDESDRALLVRDDGEWTDPTGPAHPDEPLDEAAVRIVEDATETECALTAVERARIVGVIDANASAVDPVYRLVVRFRGRPIDDQPLVNGTVKWDDEPPTDATERTLRTIG